MTGTGRICRVKVEHIDDYALVVWCDKDLEKKIANVEGVSALAPDLVLGEKGKHWATIDHRYDTMTVALRIMEVSHEGAASDQQGALQVLPDGQAEGAGLAKVGRWDFIRRHLDRLYGWWIRNVWRVK